MPPWNQMSPQQQLQFLQMMRAQFGGGGMMPPGAGAPGIVPGQQMMQPGMMPGATAANNPLLNPAGAQMNPAMNQQLMQYLMQLRGAPSMAQMLSPQGGNTWGLGL